MRSAELSRFHHDVATPLPEVTESPKLVRVVDLKEELAPAGASRFVRTKVHEVVRGNGTTGYQVVNEMAPGVSLVPVDVVNGKGYALLVDQLRYPHHQPGTTAPSLREAAERGTIGRWSRETISGGVNPEEEALGELGLKLAGLREGAEEAGIKNIDPETVQRILPTLYSSVSVNNQSFNLFAVRMNGETQWDPEVTFADLEEGNMKVGAYRLDTAVPEMINNGTIWEMSTVTALNGLYRLDEFRPYLA